MSVSSTVNFTYGASLSEFACYQRKVNSYTGDLTFVSNVTNITTALANRFGLTTVQTSFARKLEAVSDKRHYKYGTTMMEDILAGKTRRHANSYI